MDKLNLNSFEAIAIRFFHHRINARDPYIMLFGRTIIFLCVGLLMWSLFLLMGKNPIVNGIIWWPFQVIIGNIVCFFLLRHFAVKEGIKFSDYFGFRKQLIGKDIVTLLLLTPLIIITGGIGLYGSSYIIFGTMPPTTMFQPMPLWAAVISVVLFPLSNAMVELTTYYGYSMPRIEVQLAHRWVALFLAAFMLSFQHTAFPLVPDWGFFIWRVVGFLPLTITLGIIYKKLGRLAPLTIGHYFMDLQLILMVFFASLK